MSQYFHSVRLERDKCSGCTNCIKRCPTEAIRVQQGKAKIMDERCIDCGECIRVCPYHAKYALTDNLSAINSHKYKIALPAPALYAQFKGLNKIDRVLAGLKLMGFDDVYEVAKGAEIVSRTLKDRLSKEHKKPLISSACPAVVRLIQVRFPELIDNIVDVRSPMEVAAGLARQEFCKRYGADPEEVGCFFITPCAAKVTAIRKPIGHTQTQLNGAISMMEIYGLLSVQMKKETAAAIESMQPPTGWGLGWARSGGECKALDSEEALAVDGIDDVNRVLEAIENDRLPNLRFFEGQACDEGCVGGPIAFENPFIARNRIRQLSLTEKSDVSLAEAVTDRDLAQVGHMLRFDAEIQSVDSLRIDTDLKQALAKMQRIEEIRKKLPGLDCGSCGSPTCQALAEDIVGGFAREMDCLFLLKEQVRLMAKQMVDISEMTREK